MKTKQEMTDIILNLLKSELNYKCSVYAREQIMNQKDGYIEAMLHIANEFDINEDILWEEIDKAKQEII